MTLSENKMRKKFLTLMLCVFSLAISSCENNVSETKPLATKTSQTTPVTQPSIPKDGNYDGKGEITKINLEGGSIEIKHEK